MAYQKGSIYKYNGSWFLKYRTTELKDGTAARVHKTERLHNLISRVIKPHVEGKKECEICGKVPKKSGVQWKTLYAGRRGACTAAIEATNGNYAVAQALLRHKSMTTTLNVYQKAITPEAFKNGMRLLEAAAGKGK